MNIALLSEQQIKSIYNDRLLKDFAKDEIKPLNTLLKLFKSNNYKAFGAFCGSELIGYAFLMITNDGEILLDYYAIVPQFRQKGLGSEFLKRLIKTLREYPALIFEVERVLSAKDEAQRLTREKRVEFYLKNGAEKTGVEATVYGVDYSIMCFPINEKADDSRIKSAMHKFYSLTISEEKYSKYVSVY